MWPVMCKKVNNLFMYRSGCVYSTDPLSSMYLEMLNIVFESYEESSSYITKEECLITEQFIF